MALALQNFIDCTTTHHFHATFNKPLYSSMLPKNRGEDELQRANEHHENCELEKTVKLENIFGAVAANVGEDDNGDMSDVPTGEGSGDNIDAWYSLDSNNMLQRSSMRFILGNGQDYAADVMSVPLVYAENVDNGPSRDPVAIAVPMVTEVMGDKSGHYLPVSNYHEFYDDLIIRDVRRHNAKRSSSEAGEGTTLMSSLIGCDCKIRNNLLDLGVDFVPRYLLNAVCQTHDIHYIENGDSGVGGNDVLLKKCRGGSRCQALEYKVKVLTMRNGRGGHHALPYNFSPRRALRQQWRFKTITVAAGCFCSY